MIPTQPSVFVSYSHTDQPFVQRLAADLKVSGARVWIDEAELRVGDSLLSRIEHAIDQADYLAAVLSPHSVSSRWVSEELQQALHMQIAGRPLTVLPILIADCDLPGFLRTRVHADFRNDTQYAHALELLLRSLGIQTVTTVGAVLLDPLATTYERIDGFYARPRVWYCIECGEHVPIRWGYPSQVCSACNASRFYMDVNTTIAQCAQCHQLNIAGAIYCEWCGARMPKI